AASWRWRRARKRRNSTSTVLGGIYFQTFRSMRTMTRTTKRMRTMRTMRTTKTTRTMRALLPRAPMTTESLLTEKTASRRCSIKTLHPMITRKMLLLSCDSGSKEILPWAQGKQSAR
ncbi:unnamed protein product, partial [Ascophyllum nodosum]